MMRMHTATSREGGRTSFPPPYEGGAGGGSGEHIRRLARHHRSKVRDNMLILLA